MASIESFREVLNPLLDRIDVFLPSDKELMLLMDTDNLEKAIDLAGDMGANHLAIKMGDRGGLLAKEGPGSPALPKCARAGVGSPAAFLRGGIHAARHAVPPGRERWIRERQECE